METPVLKPRGEANPTGPSLGLLASGRGGNAIVGIRTRLRSSVRAPGARIQACRPWAVRPLTPAHRVLVLEAHPPLVALPKGQAEPPAGQACWPLPPRSVLNGRFHF